MMTEPAPWTRHIQIRVSQSGRFWEPWNYHVTDGPMIVGEAGSGCTGWSRRHAIRRALKRARVCADHHLTRGEAAIIEIVDESGGRDG